MDLEQERELVERARNDAEAFAELYDRYYPQIFGYVLNRLRRNFSGLRRN